MTTSADTAAIELLPCPFCGGEPTVSMRHCDDGQPWLWKCNGPCFLERINSGPTREEAIGRFNARATAPTTGSAPVARECYLVKGYGETDLPDVTIVSSLSEARQAAIGMIYIVPAEADTEEMAELFEHFEVSMQDDNAWEAQFEIGGIEVERISYAAPPANAPAASVLTDQEIEDVLTAHFVDFFSNGKIESEAKDLFNGVRAIIAVFMGGDKA